ncbi:MAG: hypothetical protein JWO56_3532 [Acidobacteria bacterium]|nr:hypothetical protein [Acidobacteriota bacterium]
MTASGIRAPLSVTTVLDETVDVVSSAAPWAAVSIVTALPYRFLQVVFIERLVELGQDAKHYANALGTLATFTIVAFLVSLVGRAVWIRACGLAQQRATLRPRDVFRVSPAALLSYLFTSALIATLFYSIWITLISVPLLIVVSGLAAGTMELNERPSLLEPLRLIKRYAKNARIVVALLLVFAIAFVIAAVNLFALFTLGLWLAHAFTTAGLSRWDVLLGFGNAHFVWLLLAGALVAVEPFWIAANVVQVRKAGAAESGDDLRHWLEELTAR